MNKFFAAGHHINRQSQLPGGCSWLSTLHQNPHRQAIRSGGAGGIAFVSGKAKVHSGVCFRQPGDFVVKQTFHFAKQYLFVF